MDKEEKKTSDYGNQLFAKQKIKGYYGNITEKQFKKIYKEADRKKGDTGENLIQLLESRLDTVVYRMKFAPTVFASRQLINHGHILVNNKKLDIASAFVKKNDVIEIKESSKNKEFIILSTKIEERDIPQYLDVNIKEMKGTFLNLPLFSEVPYPVKMEPNQVVEFYSR